MKIKRGDTVLVTVGKDRNKTGTVERVLTKRGKAIVTGLNMVKKHLKKSAKTPQGGIIDKSLPVNISNLMVLDPSKNKPTRVGYSVSGKSKIRIGKLSNQQITKDKK